ncbi:MAG: Smr/MutS family protein [Deltaproteobacteria bacterium]|nr:Smr/MutS family protein [Deltaproteobacteria bacterium]
MTAPTSEFVDPAGQALLDLGFPRLLEALAGRARTDLGQARALRRPLHADADDVREALAMVEEARLLAGEQRVLPLAGARDVRALVARAGKGATLEGPELVQLAHVMAALSRTRDFLEDVAGRVPRLARLGEQLVDLTSLARRIDSAFEPSGQVSDRASPELAAARERSRGLHKQLKSKIEDLLADVENEELLRDRYFTLRNDRYVVPVKAQHRAQLPGIVHNASQSGQTLFVEPQPLIGLGNELAIAQSVAAEEERRVLQELTDLVGKRADELLEALEAIAALDEAEACARLANDLHANVPELTKPSSPFNLKALRHPLLVLQGKKVIASDVRLEAPARALIVSGPNAGGKTVTLTGVGLCALMLRAGLPIPVEAGSSLPLYPGVSSAIGDAQDLGRDLSTFSAHITALRDILKSCGPGSLVLIDEVAADTDPREGAAIATAILEALLEHGATSIVTTHLEELKALGLGDTRFANAHVGFDPVNLAPTYKLHLGSPGASSAIEIAQRVGLPAAVCERARSHLSGTAGPLAKALEKLEAERAALETARLEAQKLAADAKAERDAAQAQLRDIETRLRAESEAARAKLVKDLEAAQVRVSELVAELQVQPTLAKAAEVRRQLREEESSQKRELAKSQAEPSEPEERGGELTVGARVRVISLGREAQVSSIDGNEATVQAGALRMRVPLDDLVPLKGKAKIPEPKLKAAAGAQLAKAATTGAGKLAAPIEQVDVRGLRAEDALRMVEAFLDRLYGEGRPAAVIVHGHGTGALKATLREYLQQSPYVERWQAESGDGATRVEFRG